MRDFISQINKKYIVLIILFFLYMPFPTEMIPEWEIQILDENKQPLANVRTEQSWKNYTFFAVSGYDQKCSDSKGKVVYPKRYLWAGVFSRVISPISADILTLAHGSTGTWAHIVIDDEKYTSDFYYWGEKEEIYTRTREPLPKTINARLRESPKPSKCK